MLPPFVTFPAKYVPNGVVKPQAHSGFASTLAPEALHSGANAPFSKLPLLSAVSHHGHSGIRPGSLPCERMYPVRRLP